MIDGAELVRELGQCGVTHVVWIPDSQLGAWDTALRSATSPRLIRVCREGEAIAVAAGLMLGGQRPIVVVQCTGFFEAGDALRNVVHDLKLPLFLVVGVRSYQAHQKRATEDSCPVFTEPVVKAWQVPYVVLDDRHSAADLAAEYRKARAANRAAILLLAE